MITAHIQLIMVIIGLMTMGSLVFFLAPGVLGERLLGITEICPGLILPRSPCTSLTEHPELKAIPPPS